MQHFILEAVGRCLSVFDLLFLPPQARGPSRAAPALKPEELEAMLVLTIVLKHTHTPLFVCIFLSLSYPTVVLFQTEAGQRQRASTGTHYRAGPVGHRCGPSQKDRVGEVYVLCDLLAQLLVFTLAIGHLSVPTQ